jgi:hypothetical protein
MRNSAWPSPKVLAGSAKSNCGAIAGALAVNYGSVKATKACIAVYRCVEKPKKTNANAHFCVSLSIAVFPHILDIVGHEGFTA